MGRITWPVTPGAAGAGGYDRLDVEAGAAGSTRDAMLLPQNGSGEARNALTATGPFAKLAFVALVAGLIVWHMLRPQLHALEGAIFVGSLAIVWLGVSLAH